MSASHERGGLVILLHGRPSSESCRSGPDVVLGKISYAESKELQQFTPIVFVRRATGGITTIQVVQHGRIDSDCSIQIGQRSGAEAPEKSQLICQCGSHPSLESTGHQQVVPEPTHAVLERSFGRDHTGKPRSRQPTRSLLATDTGVGEVNAHERIRCWCNPGLGRRKDAADLDVNPPVYGIRERSDRQSEPETPMQCCDALSFIHGSSEPTRCEQTVMPTLGDCR